MTDFDNNLSAQVRNKLLARLEKVMALAGEGANTTQEEMAAATERMLSLLDKLGIDEEQARKELEVSGQRTKSKIVADSVAWIYDIRTTWEMSLGIAVATGCNCELVWTPQHSTFIGTEVDTAAACFLWSQLAHRLDGMSQVAATSHARELKQVNGGKSTYKLYGQAYLKRYRRNWLAGAVDALRTRLVERQQLVDSQVKALMVVKNERIKLVMREMYPQLRVKKVGSVNSDGQARSDGHRAGASMSIHSALNGNTSRGLLVDGIE